MVTAFRCVACTGELRDERTRVQCSRCAAVYPQLVTGIPVLLQRADAQCAATAHTLEQQIQTTDNLLARFRDQLANAPRRPEALARMCVSCERFGVFYRRLLGALDHTWPIDRHRLPAPEPATMNVEYFIRDWRRAAHTEASIGTVMGALERQLASASRRAIAVLGAGGGRFAWELAASSEQVIALDYAIPSALSWALLTRGPIELCELQDSNVPAVEELCVPFDARLAGEPGEEARLARMRWVVADGVDVPLGDGTLSAVVSAYFTDRVSPWRLLDEVHRLLEPGGVFVHLGPFHMAHFNPDEGLTADELVAALAARGLRVISSEWVEHSLLASRSLVQIHARAFACAAVKER